MKFHSLWNNGKYDRILSARKGAKFPPSFSKVFRQFLLKCRVSPLPGGLKIDGMNL